MPVYSHQHKWLPGPYIPGEMKSFALGSEYTLPNPASMLIVCSVCAQIKRLSIPTKLNDKEEMWAQAKEVSTDELR